MTTFSASRPSLARRTATAGLLTAALATAAPLAAPAGASDWSVGSHRIDEDYVRVSAPDNSAHVIDSHAMSFHRSGRVQAQLHGGVHRATTAPGCRSARVVFVFADETRETSRESARACSQYGVTYKDIDIHPTKSKDVVRYAVQLLRSTDISAPAAVIAGTTYLVGDSPDSYGTAARLDHDAFEMVHAGQRVFTEGASNWWIQREDVAGVSMRFARGRVSGMLVRPTGLGGQKAWLRVVWTHADGSTKTQMSGVVTSATPRVWVNLSSDRYKEAVSVELKVITDLPASTAPMVTRFGDYYGR